MRKMTKRSAIITAVAVVAVGAGAAAWAANGWTVGGTGTSEGTAATITPITATANLGSVKVYPGLSTRVDATVNNTNDFPVVLNNTAVVPTGVEVTGGQNATNCQNTATAQAFTASFDNGAVVPKNGHATVGSNLTFGELPQDCVGAHFKVSYTFTAASTA